MSKDKPTPVGRSKKKTAVSLVRSSAAEYLTFIAASGEGGVEAVYADEDVWLSQKMMGTLYDVNVRTVNEHLKKIFADSELHEDSVIRKFRITATDGKNYHTLHYKLSHSGRPSHHLLRAAAPTGRYGLAVPRSLRQYIPVPVLCHGSYPE